jgi:hypothetical protein
MDKLSDYANDLVNRTIAQLANYQCNKGYIYKSYTNSIKSEIKKFQNMTLMQNNIDFVVLELL